VHPCTSKINRFARTAIPRNSKNRVVRQNLVPYDPANAERDEQRDHAIPQAAGRIAAGYGSPIAQALQARRPDIVELLVDHGADPRAVDMTEVLDSWDPKVFDFFISRGANVVQGQPFAHAFSIVSVPRSMRLRTSALNGPH
jgi:hypothetical protein